MKQIISALRTETLSKWQNISLDILEKKFETAKVQHMVEPADFDNTIKQVGLSFEEFQQLCESQFNRRQNADRIEKKSPYSSWGCWMQIRVKFTLSKKQFQLIRRNMTRDCYNNHNEQLFNDNLPLFGNYYLQSKVSFFSPRHGNKYYIIDGSVFYSDKKNEYKTIR